MKEKFTLVDALLACLIMQMDTSHNTVLLQLRPAIT
jgi:hypothetical protein